MLKFAWDEVKAATNLAKHGVSFEEAATVFGDPLAISFDDPDRAGAEHRFLTFGMSEKSRILLVVNGGRGRTVRIISARKATKHERGIYEQG